MPARAAFNYYIGSQAVGQEQHQQFKSRFNSRRKHRKLKAFSNFLCLFPCALRKAKRDNSIVMIKPQLLSDQLWQLFCLGQQQKQQQKQNKKS